jgi:hypothetical protein
MQVVSRMEHPRKASFSMIVSREPVSKVTVERDAQYAKLSFSIPCTLAGMQMNRKAEPEKTLSGRLVR